jgi:hypothetical protein
MARVGDVLNMLIPSGEWVQVGDTYEGIEFLSDVTITKTEYEAGFAQYDAMKAEAEAQAATDKAALLAKLGITADEAKLLLS